jgi:hypothetical protein
MVFGCVVRQDDRMVADSHRDVVLAALRSSLRPLDDDQLSDQTGILPRQQVNQICRALERLHLVRRFVGPSQKIVNEIVSPTNVEPSSVDARSQLADGRGGAVVEQVRGELPRGSSREQRAAERVILDLLGARLGYVLQPARLSLQSGVRVEVDGVNADRTVLVECWAHQGGVKSAQRQKVLTDAFKLSWIANTIYPRPRLILCMSDHIAASPFLSAKSWPAQALRDAGIEVIVVDLPPDVRHQVEEAQRRQYR